MTKSALVTGAAGQDGHYLIPELVGAGYEVHALYRGQDEVRLQRLRHDYTSVNWIRGDVTDPASVAAAVIESQPIAVFNLAGLSFVGTSWNAPRLYMETNAIGTLNVLEAVRVHARDAHVVQASTSEMYGNALTGPANEQSPMEPASPYGVSKLAAHRMVKVYRDSYGMRASSAIMFNHESPHRPPAFVTRKVTQAAARIKAGLQETVELGNVHALRDWGFAGDYMHALRLMSERFYGDDFVIGTGETYSVEALAMLAFRSVGLNWEDHVRVADTEKRPNDLQFLAANAKKVQDALGWQPTIRFDALVRMMVEADVAALRQEVLA